MKDELLSIIVPIYNSENSLENCIRSIEKQEYSNYELILINDGSTDNSLKICEKLAQKNEKIKIINKKNTGVSDTRNRGIEIAKGKYIQFVDSDDEVCSTLSKKLIELIRKNNADMGICGYTIIKKSKKIEKINKNINCNYDLYCLYEKYLLHPIWNKIYIKEKITNKFDIDISLGEDILFNIEYLMNNGKIVFLPENLYKYKNDGEISLSSMYFENTIYVSNLIYTKIDELYKKYYGNNYKRDSINKIFYHCIMNNINNISINKKLNYIEKRKMIRENLKTLKEKKDWKNIIIKYEMIEVIILFFNLKAKVRKRR